jgi:internalin A
MEDQREYKFGALRFRNYPLQYWVEYVRHLGEQSSPALIVQTRCDASSDEIRRFPVNPSVLQALGYCKELHYSALNERGRAALDEALRDAAGWLRDPARMGAAMNRSGADAGPAPARKRCGRQIRRSLIPRNAAIEG